MMLNYAAIFLYLILRFIYEKVNSLAVRTLSKRGMMPVWNIKDAENIYKHFYKTKRTVFAYTNLSNDESSK
jgi:hypothetical protein